MGGLLDSTVKRPAKPTALGGGGLGSHLATRAAGLGTTAGTAVGVRALEAALGMRFDAAPACLFLVELSGVLVALFTECGGLQVKRGVEEVKEGGVNNYVHKLPGRLEFSTITLKRGLSLSRGLWDWMMQGRHDFQVKRLNFSIIQGAPGRWLGKVKHWDLEDAYPVRWELSTLTTSGNDTAIETLEIAHHGLSLSYEVLSPMGVTAGIGG
jgi:phage tail-like protein